MATDTAERRAAHLRGLTVTTLASVAGIAAAVVSAGLTADAANPATDRLGLYVLVAAVLVQFPILQLAGIDVGDFSGKDYLYVAFMTFAMWFVSWGVLLTANTPISF
ncbi:MAG: hypothetical protein ABEJ31_14350 [Haloarculaceae archaeon]